VITSAGVPSAATRPAAAQFPPEVRGRVVESVGGAPVAGARVEVVDGDARAVAGADGAFVLRGLVPGAHELRARALGYRERRARVEAVNGQVTRVIVELDAVPALLDRVVVTDAGPRGAAGATVFARADVERSGARDVGELVEDAAGVVVTRRGGPGSPAHASIRGGSANQVLVLVDGVPINEPITGNADLSAVPLEAVERVTVLRGAQSARYGGQALSGVIAVETRRPRTGHPYTRSTFSRVITSAGVPSAATRPAERSTSRSA
jgi:outer membrane receptor protein involved in Fe transport